jgi:hypothetical protein
VPASGGQLEELLAWAEPFEARTWAVEAAAGWGYLLSQQLVDAGEVVLDVPATLAARVRVLGTGRSNKNDPNDARSVAIAALRAPQLASVQRPDHNNVLRLLAKRNLDIGRAKNRTACRLHSLLAELVPGGIPNRINGSRAQQLLDQVQPATPMEAMRLEIAYEHLDDLRRLDDQLAASRKRLTAIDRSRRPARTRRTPTDRLITVARVDSASPMTGCSMGTGSSRRFRRPQDRRCGDEDQAALDRRREVLGLAVTEVVTEVRRSAARRTAHKPTRAATRFTTDSMASERKPTEPVTAAAEAFSAMVTTAAATESSISRTSVRCCTAGSTS